MKEQTRSRYYVREEKQNHQKKRDPYAEYILQFLESEQLLFMGEHKSGIYVCFLRAIFRFSFTSE